MQITEATDSVLDSKQLANASEYGTVPHRETSHWASATRTQSASIQRSYRQTILQGLVNHGLVNHGDLVKLKPLCSIEPLVTCYKGVAYPTLSYPNK